jgi:MFS family permease
VTVSAPATAPAAPPGDGSPWSAPGLRALFVASTTARLANEAARVAMVLLVLERTGSPALAGAVVGAATVPSLVTGPLLGAWLDRTRHRRRAFVANQLLLLLALLGLLTVDGSTPAVAVLALGLVAGLTSPVLTGGFTGLIAPLVPAAALRRAYGAEATSYNVAAVTGPALAGVVAGLLGSGAAVATAAVLSALALPAVLRVPMPPGEGAGAAGRDGLVRTVGRGVRHLVSTPPLRAVTLATTASFGGMGALPVVLPVLAVELGAGAAASGAMLSAFALGALTGSLAVAARTPRTSALRTAVQGIAGLALVFAAMAVAPGLPAALVLIAVAGVLEGPVLAATLTVRELHTPGAMRTQVVTTAASIKFGAFALGSAVAGAVVAASGARAGLAVVAGAQVLGVALGLAGRRTR